MGSLQGLLWLLGGTNPYPDAPTITPDDSTGPSAGGDGNCTGPDSDERMIWKINQLKLMVHLY